MAKKPSVIGVTTDAVRDTITGTATMVSTTMRAANNAALMLEKTTEYALAANAAWCAEGMANFSDEERLFIAESLPTLKLPPQAAQAANDGNKEQAADSAA